MCPFNWLSRWLWEDGNIGFTMQLEIASIHSKILSTSHVVSSCLNKPKANVYFSLTPLDFGAWPKWHSIVMMRDSNSFPFSVFIVQSASVRTIHLQKQWVEINSKPTSKKHSFNFLPSILHFKSEDLKKNRWLSLQSVSFLARHENSNKGSTSKWPMCEF